MTENNSMVMPVGPVGGGYGNGGFGFGDNGAWWLLILLIAMGGWGNGFGFGGGFGGGAGTMMVNNDVQRGFDQAAVTAGISGIQNAVTSGFGDIQTALCGGFGTVNSNIANGFAQAQIADNARQIADMNQAFAMQTAMLGAAATTGRLRSRPRRLYRTKAQPRGAPSRAAFRRSSTRCALTRSTPKTRRSSN